MKYYQDITLLPDPETDLYFLWQKVYLQVHLALVEVKDANEQVSVGVSWPNYQYSPTRKHLGNKLRIFAETEEELKAVDVQKWLSRFADYVHITQVRLVPDSINEYACFSRVIVKSSKERIARRKAKRENISFDEALSKLAGMVEEHTSLPFIKLKSLSQNQLFPLFIKRELVTRSCQGEFSCYGLSKTVTVPWF